jgi:hypothetical protein
MKRLLVLAAVAATGSVLVGVAPASALPCIGPAHICLPNIECPAWDCFPPPG